MYSYKRPLECTSALCLSLLGSSHTDIMEELSVITQYESLLTTFGTYKTSRLNKTGSLAHEKSQLD